MRRRLLLLLAGLLTAGAASAARGGELWTSPRGSPEGRASLAWSGFDPGAPAGTQIREWHYLSKADRRYRPGQPVWASPALAVIGGRPMAFIGGCDQRMHALDLLEKRPVWINLTQGPVSSAPAVGLVGGEPAVFWGAADRKVYAYWADSRGDVDGRKLWERTLVPPTPTLTEGQLSAPLLYGGRLFISCFVYDKAAARSQQKGWLFCRDLATGAPLWQQEVSQGPVGDPAGCLIDGRFTVFVAARKGLLQAWDVSGERPRELWKYQMPHEVRGAPVLDESPGRPLLFLGSKFGDLHAIDARTGQRAWTRMAGNWIDNSACVGEAGGERRVYVGSHDYNLYALSCRDGSVRWKQHLGGEVYSAPTFFSRGGAPLVAAASLNNRLYVLDAASGEPVTSFHTGTPVWDKAPKGETPWGSPAALEAGGQTALVLGSISDFVYVYPLEGECVMRSTAQSPATLWWGLLVTLLLFAGAVLPAVLWLPRRSRGAAPR